VRKRAAELRTPSSTATSPQPRRRHNRDVATTATSPQPRHRHNTSNSNSIDNPPVSSKKVCQQCSDFRYSMPCEATRDGGIQNETHVGGRRGLLPTPLAEWGAAAPAPGKPLSYIRRPQNENGDESSRHCLSSDQTSTRFRTNALAQSRHTSTK
jgi:hypothetical protein